MARRRLVKKARRDVANLDDIPEEILMEILARLPVKSLVCSSSVCKSWWNLINNNPFFISHHLLEAKCGNLLMKKQQDSIDRIHNKGPMCLDIFLPDVDDETINNLPDPLPLYVPPRLQRYGYSPTASSNGLLFVEKSPESYIIWNPATRRYKEIRSNKDELDDTWEIGDFYHYLLGFGVVAETNDYKVVRIDLDKKRAKGRIFSRVQVYSRLSCSWRDIDSSTFPTRHKKSKRDLRTWNKKLEKRFEFESRDPMYTCAHGHLSSVILKGVLYWILEEGIIIGFKIRDEVFCQVPMPDIQRFHIMPPSSSLQLTEVNGSLAMITCNYSSGYYDIWVFNEKEDTWVMKFTLKVFYANYLLVGHWENFWFFQREKG